MYKIENKKFQPIKEHPEFIITLKPMTHLAYMEIMIQVEASEPSESPKDSKPIQWTKTFVEKMLEYSVIAVEGLQNAAGETVSEWKGLSKVLQRKEMDLLLAEINKDVTPGSAEIKN